MNDTLERADIYVKARSLQEKIGIGALAIIAITVLAGSYFRILDSYELETLDFRFRLRPPMPVTDTIVIIEVGDDTIQKLGRFPFDRSYHAIITKALADAGAKAIIFDIFFSESQKSDSDFESAVRDAGNVYFPVVFELDPKNSRTVPYAVGYAAECLPDLASAAKGIGHINVIPDVDGKFRRAPAYIRYEKYLLQPYLSLLVACDYLGISQKDVKFFPGKYLALGRNIRVPLDENSNIIINFSSKWGKSYRHYSYVDIIQSYLAKISGEAPHMNLSALKGKICLIGLTAVGTVDLHATPFDTLYPTMGMHAETFNSILANRFISRTSRSVNVGILLFLSMLITLVVFRIKPFKGFVYLLSVILILILSGMVVFNIFGVWIDLIYPILVMVILHLTLTLYKYVSEWKHRLLIENELGIAKKIQESFLPKSMPSMEGVRVAASMFTARQVGGDLYDFVRFGENKLGVMIGDVSGKGVPASLFMAMSVGAFRSLALPGESPASVLANLNIKLVNESSSNLFVTMFYAIFDLAAGTVIYGNGGHLPVLYLRKDGESRFLDVKDGSPLGLIDGPYSSGTTSFSRGDTFVFYTDGVTEAMNAKADMYGSDRLLAIAEKNKLFSADKILEEIEKDVRCFEPKSSQHDDITIVVLKITP